MALAKKKEIKDTRKIAIYARKSKITESGKSIENQITKCKGYAELKFNATDEDIIVYPDEGLSGFYSDRPHYMQMLKDIADNKIKAVICYKFDRISRRTLELLNLVEQLRIKEIAFISCTDDIDTGSRAGKMLMSLLAAIAEFERDIIAERISDNMYELAKDGRWLGGLTPTGYTSKKEYIRSGAKKTSINHLEPVTEELEFVKETFSRFIKEKSITRVVFWANDNKISTKKGKEHTVTSIRNILCNPVYAIADEDTYAYFSAFDVPIYAEKNEFDGTHGLMIYNKTAQSKEIKQDSTALKTNYVKKTTRKEIEEWIISIGKHQGIIEGKDWVLTQSILKDNQNKYNRPNERSESLLSGIIACPFCGKNMYTHRESGRSTNGKPRFLYKCQTKLKDKEACKCKDIKGNSVDNFVLEAICSMGENKTKYFEELSHYEASLKDKKAELELKIKEINKNIEACNRNIISQTEALRDAPEVAKKYIFSDIETLDDQIKKYEEQEEELRAEMDEFIDIKDTFQKSFELVSSSPHLINSLSFKEKSDLVHKIVEKIFVIPNANGDDEVHIFVKGFSDNDYKDFFQIEPERSDLCTRSEYSIFNAARGVCRKPYSLFRVICRNALYKSYCAY